ncbi:MAG TPA: hypothetical protein VM597_07965, partial [Gemmataceae bacterium]|nr:hypothetical protein [Gemmataceae bacterium]
MRSRHQPLPRLICLEDRSVPANILQVEPIWISPQHVREFAPDGTFVGQITPPLGDPRDVVVSPNGDVHVFSGTFSPQLSTYHPATQTWTHRTTANWSTVNNLSYGGIAAYADYVYVTDMQTAYETAPFNGIIRFNFADDTVERFAQGRNYIAMCLGLDGYLYVMGGQTGMGNDIDKYDPETMQYLGTFRAPLGDGRGVAVGANGDYYVADWGNTINRFDAAGTFIRAQNGGNGAVDVSLDGQVISGNQLMDLDLNIIGNVGDGNYHAGFATPQIPDFAPNLYAVEPTALAVVEGAPGVPVSDTIAIDPGRSPTIAGATVAVAENFVPGEDVLSFDPTGAIAGTFNPATGVLSLTGVASVADYQAALRAVKYEYTGDDASGAPRRVSFQVDDGNTSHHLSNTVSRVVQIAPVNDAPAVGLPAAEPLGYENEFVAVDGLTVVDADAGTGSLRLRLSAPDGQISLLDLSAVDVVGGFNSSTMIEIEGTLAELNQVLAAGNLSVRAAPEFVGTVVLTLALDDQANTGTGGPLTDTADLAVRVNPALPHLEVVDASPVT